MIRGGRGVRLICGISTLGISARAILAHGILAHGILAHICARTPRVRNPRAEILYPRVRGRGAKFVICAEIPQVVT